MKIIIGFFLIILPFISLGSTQEDLLNLSYSFLEHLQNKENTADIVKTYSNLDLEELAKLIDNETEKKAFWINTYNAFVQQILLANQSLFDDRGKFFGNKQVNIAGILMSFDDIEHGIIRSSRWKLSLGYLRDPFVPKFIRLLRTKKPDGRVHFALNCGAKSCPPIATFHADKIENELDKISKQYLKRTTKIDGSNITITPLMSWFRADFGGKKGIKKDFLQKFGIIHPDLKKINLSFGSYDWTLSLGNYTTL
ncbi:MAG: DUF547 domain-containing protein [Crocinitomicaceae bacterium]